MTTDHPEESWVGEEEFVFYAVEQIKKVQETIGTLNWVNTAALAVRWYARFTICAEVRG